MEWLSIPKAAKHLHLGVQEIARKAAAARWGKTK